jgi:hypothetical protein
MTVYAYLNRDKGVQNRRGMCHNLDLLKASSCTHIAKNSVSLHDVSNKHINAYKIKVALWNTHNHGMHTAF